MDIFVRNLPAEATQKQVDDFFSPLFAACRIYDYYCDKSSGKSLANITVLNARAAQKFLDAYGVPNDAPNSAQPQKPLYWNRKLIRCCRNRKGVNNFSVKSLAYEASEKARKAAQSTAVQNYNEDCDTTRFYISSVHCGYLGYNGKRLSFTSQFNTTQPGMISFGLKEAVIVLGGEHSNHRRIYLAYASCNDIILSPYGDRAITFSLTSAPKFYEVGGVDPLADMLLYLTLGPTAPKPKAPKKIKITGIDDTHSKVAVMCLVYRISLSDEVSQKGINSLNAMLRRIVKDPGPKPWPTELTYPIENIEKVKKRLDVDLTYNENFGLRPFPILYQLDRLARNGVLPPQEVIALLPTVAQIQDAHGLDATLSALRKFYRQVPFAGPSTDASELSQSALEAHLRAFASSYAHAQYNPKNPYELTKRHVHINLIHKISITPCGIYLQDPEPEPTNRVLRRYNSHINNFARVVFQDEDSSAVRYDPQASQDLIYHGRFKEVLDGGVLITGRMFSFLGFSHSSLRSQSCWFMSPLVAEDSIKFPNHILKELGDFSNIRVPAKCAARIGQNFADTNATVDLSDNQVGHLPMVQYSTYDFSGGVGTISSELLKRIWRVYGRRRLLKPTAIQIRYKGYKGMVALNSRLRGERLMLRDNMKKFDAPSAWTLEICGAAFKPLPMVLNRQFIKIFEDLGIPDSVFMDLRRIAVEKLRDTAASNSNAASFLDQGKCTKSTRIPGFLLHLEQLGFDYRKDTFLYKVVEMLVITRLRDTKYRGRIPVEPGVMLYGIMDETGELGDSQIFVVTESSPEGGRKVVVKNRIVVTRSPAMHPVDVQIVEAVDVRPDSPLQKLSNIVVFSRHGVHDLPSQLSGGDLDGDLFNVLYEPGLIPEAAHAPAEYPRVSAAALDRDVTPKDMSDFFVTFMENDLLGMISNLHMQAADQSEIGTFDDKCNTVASLASTAVDFSKTGVQVDTMKLPKHDRLRPDFMAPFPRMIISEKDYIALKEEDNNYEPAFEGLDPERCGIRYYESQKILGSLYRAIDEHQFLAKMDRDRMAIQATLFRSNNLIVKVLQHTQRHAEDFGLDHEHHVDLARDIRAG